MRNIGMIITSNYKMTYMTIRKCCNFVSEYLNITYHNSVNILNLREQAVLSNTLLARRPVVEATGWNSGDPEWTEGRLIFQVSFL